MPKKNLTLINRYASHIPVLLRILTDLNKPIKSILEIGCGFYSTPLLNAFATGRGCKHVIMESNKVWKQKISDMFHVDIVPFSVKALPVPAGVNWDIVFIDSETAKDRATYALQLQKHAKIILLHDSNANWDHAYGYSKIIEKWKYHHQFSEHYPHTLLLTDDPQVKECAFMLDTAEIFTNIHDKRSWGRHGSVSGRGSTITVTDKLRVALAQLLHEFKLTTMLDIPCGDYNWMQHVNMATDYLGADIVPSLIHSNIKKFGNKFKVLDLLTDSLPQVDLIFCRDCLVHLSHADVNRALRNMQASGSKYMLTTTFTNNRNNRNIPTGQWSPYNLQLAPFGLPEPLTIINEDYGRFRAAYKDKSVGLWPLESILK